MDMKKWIKVLLVVLTLIVAFLFALNGRYTKINGSYYFDKWTQRTERYN